MDQESLWEEFLDGIYSALSLLQMVQEGNRFIALGGQNPWLQRSSVTAAPTGTPALMTSD